MKRYEYMFFRLHDDDTVDLPDDFIVVKEVVEKYVAERDAYGSIRYGLKVTGFNVLVPVTD